MQIGRQLRILWPWRWWYCLRALVGGVRLHPSTCFFGNSLHIKLGLGTKIGERCRLDVGATGRIVSGERVWVSSDVEIETTTSVYIGEGSTLQRRCTINGSTRIGAGCIFTPNVFVSSGTHPFRVIAHLPIREQERRLAASDIAMAELDRPVWIQDDCWLGTNVVVCPGVTIGKGSIVGANSVVTSDIPPYSVFAGVPAKTIGQRLQWTPRNSISADREEDLPYILSGRMVNATADRPACIEASLHTPFCVALVAHETDQKLILEWYAPAPVQFEIEGCNFSLPAGTGRHEVALETSKMLGTVRYCTATIGSLTASAVLQIAHISIA
jgi:acetyltransferase-like isoleucine patch superfamily enzyme